jgi:glycosyltransferase involved in cell wall biosynthesis
MNNSTKSILIVSPEIPFPYFKGNQNRIDGTIKLLISRGYSVSIAILNSNQATRKSIEIEQDIKYAYPEIKDVIVRRHPKFSNKSFFYSEIKRKIFNQKGIISEETCPLNFRRVVKKYIKQKKPDIVIVNYLKISNIFPLFYSGKKIIDTHDVASDILEQALQTNRDNNFDIEKYRNSEKKALKKFDTVISINPREQVLFEEKFHCKNVHTIPSFHSLNTNKNKERKKYDILFIGSASPFNIEGFMKFNAKVLPILRKTVNKKISIALVGDICNTSAISKISSPEIHKLGRVDDLDSIYGDSLISICPLIRGAGMKIKVVEAICHGKAVVTTSVGADGILLKHGENAFIADDWNEFSSHIVTLINNDKIRNDFEKKALDLALNYYSLESASVKWGAIIEKGFFTAIDTIILKDDEYRTFPILSEPQIKKRAKGLIFSHEANLLKTFALDFAKKSSKLGIYCEFIKSHEGDDYSYHNHGFICHNYKDYITPKLRHDAADWAKKHQHIDLDLLFYKDVYIGDEIIIYQKMFPEHFKNKSMEEILIFNILCIEAIIKLCEIIKPDFILSWNGNGPHLMYIFKLVAKIIEIPVLQMERGLLPNTYLVDYRGVNYKSHLAGSYYETPKKDRIIQAKNYQENYKKSKETVVNTKSKKIIDKNEIFENLNIKKKGYIFYCEQIEGDSNIIINSPKFKKMNTVIEFLIEVSEKFELDIVVRPHPENKGKMIEYPEQIIIDNQHHLHDQLIYSEFNVVINSTVGLESLLLSRKTFTLGNSIYSGKGFTTPVYTTSDFDIYLGKPLNLTEPENIRFLSFLSTILNEYLIQPGNTRNIKTIEELYRKTLKFERFKSKVNIPKSVISQVEKNQKYLKSLDAASEIFLVNKLHKETNLYETGSNKPAFNLDDFIIKHLKSYREKITVLSKIKTRKIKFMDNNIHLVIIDPIDIELEVIKNKQNNLFYIDKYSNLIT